MSVPDAYFTFNGGETVAVIPGTRPIYHLVRDKVLSKFHIVYEKDKTNITFDYPFLPRESLLVHFVQINGLERAEKIAANKI